MNRCRVPAAFLGESHFSDGIAHGDDAVEGLDHSFVLDAARCDRDKILADLDLRVVETTLAVPGPATKRDHRERVPLGAVPDRHGVFCGFGWQGAGEGPDSAAVEHVTAVDHEVIDLEPVMILDGDAEPALGPVLFVLGTDQAESVVVDLHLATTVVGCVGVFVLVGSRPGDPDPMPAAQVPVAPLVLARFPEQQVPTATGAEMGDARTELADGNQAQG